MAGLIQNDGKMARAALASHVEQEPVAWIEFADNGNIRFWTSDSARAWTEGENGRPLRKFTLAELVALAASPCLDRERVERIASDIVEKLNCDWGYNKNPTRDEAEKTIAAAIAKLGER